MLILKKYGWIGVVLFLFALLILFNFDQEESLLQVKGESNEKSMDTSKELQDPPQKEGSFFVVDVKGEVNEPGIYDVEEGMRVNDAIQLAGGLTEKADETTINLAQKVQDEMVILVMSTLNDNNKVTEESGSNSTSVVRINYATSEEVQALPGIGPAKAEAIITYRDEQGLFKSSEDLLNVSGIGEKTLESLEEHIQIP
ncbi:helix-hairpin-helix domain-containing protein [Halobacillus sp. A5]|uniref:helix-hairpin-helix domain-containing protein n=1 Tax=Halobacillus sp. A5 TaxID=2880263 RepID=UPI0020A626E6|nr:helix-hairpin-helix domain-containing protein [Halobacillus sp. A5]MCP3025615.1 helix-hairpin-helix domain-containing protein [Halobacillus sp. A5]